jgi:hypothetical protein
VLDEVRALRRDVEDLRGLLERRRDPDAAAARFLGALLGALGDLDLPFTADEVLAHGAVDHDLGEALGVLGLTTTAAVGAAFRSWRDRPIDGVVLRREGRNWRLARCT